MSGGGLQSHGLRAFPCTACGFQVGTLVPNSRLVRFHLFNADFKPAF
jgi:hypothetical protein